MSIDLLLRTAGFKSKRQLALHLDISPETITRWDTPGRTGKTPRVVELYLEERIRTHTLLEQFENQLIEAYYKWNLKN